jgi:hypothetical protein
VYQAPFDHPLNLTMQAILTTASGGIALVLLGIAIHKGRREGTPFYVLLVLAGGLAALAEPLYDIGFKLLFYIPGQWTLFTYAGIPQPVWTISGYVTLYSGPALFICERLARGLDQRTFWRWTAVTLLASGTFETVGIKGGTYAYWGPHAFRIFEYPLAVGILETTFVMLFSVCANAYRQRITTPWHLAGLLVLFPGVFYFVNFGIGAPTLVTIGLSPPSPALVMLGTITSIAVALCVLAAIGRYATSPSSAATTARPIIMASPSVFARSARTTSL